MATKTNANQNRTTTRDHDSIYCPGCDEMGSYQGAGQRGGNWTGHTRYFRYCDDCDIRWSHKYLMPKGDK